MEFFMKEIAFISNWKSTNVRTCQNISRTPKTP